MDLEKARQDSLLSFAARSTTADTMIHHGREKSINEEEYTKRGYSQIMSYISTSVTTAQGGPRVQKDYKLRRQTESR